MKYFENWSVIVDGITLIWQKAGTAIHVICSYKFTLALFEVGVWTKNRQTAILKSLPNKLHTVNRQKFTVEKSSQVAKITSMKFIYFEY